MASVPCSFHLGSVPSSVYREYAPSFALKPFLVCAWTLDIDAGDRPHRQRVLPDGCSDIIWIGEAPPIVVGPMTRAALASSRPGTTLVGLRLRPEAAARVLGIAANEITDRRIRLDELWSGREVAEISDRLLSRRSAAGRASVAQAVLASRRHAARALDPYVHHAMTLLTAARHHRVAALAERIGISERHVRRRFAEAVGYSPKMFHRILRFQRLLALAKARPSMRLGHVALVAGYADQSHMTRDVGEFAGVTPSLLLGKVVSALALSDLLAGI